MNECKRYTTLDEGHFRPVGAITVGEIIDRLAQYEETGYAPDEITGAMSFVNGESKKAIAYECEKVDTNWLPYWKCHCGEAVDYAKKDDTHYCRNCGQKLMYAE